MSECDIKIAYKKSPEFYFLWNALNCTINIDLEVKFMARIEVFCGGDNNYFYDHAVKAIFSSYLEQHQV